MRAENCKVLGEFIGIRGGKQQQNSCWKLLGKQFLALLATVL